MTGRERVYAALNHERPDRAPRNLWALPYVCLFRPEELDELQRKFPSDITVSQISPGSDNGDLDRVSGVGAYTDEWGSVWEVAEPGVIGEVKQPALADWSALDAWQPPWDLIRKQDLSHVNRECEASDNFMLSSAIARPFERLQFLRGTEDALIDLACGASEVFKLIERIHEFYMEDAKAWSETNVDGIFFMDDWGSNQALLINPELWRKVFKPLYRDYCDVIRGAGKKVFFHSDGHIEAIYPDLIEIGVDAINSQLFCMDIEGLAERHRGEITFWGEIDRQQVLPFGSPDDVRAAVRRVRRALDRGHGGVIAQCEWGKDNSRENIEAVFEAWMD